MTEQDAFLEAILAEPRDDALRLVFSDWLFDEDVSQRLAAWLASDQALQHVSWGRRFQS
jgi:uncharacterized protein (TIGR02996 family)